MNMINFSTEKFFKSLFDPTHNSVALNTPSQVRVVSVLHDNKITKKQKRTSKFSDPSLFK